MRVKLTLLKDFMEWKAGEVIHPTQGLASQLVANGVAAPISAESKPTQVVEEKTVTDETPKNEPQPKPKVTRRSK